MLPRKRVHWLSRRVEAEALVKAGASLAVVGAAFGCSQTTASAGLRRLGLMIDPDAARERRTDFLAGVGASPESIAKRVQALKETLAEPSKKRELADRARKQWQDGEVRGRTIASLKATAALMPPEARSARSAMAGIAKLRWCPPEYRREYAQLRKRLGSAAEAKRIILDHIARKKTKDTFAR